MDRVSDGEVCVFEIGRGPRRDSRSGQPLIV